MIRFYNPVKDASIYEEFQNRQTGRDEILEIGKTSGNNSARSLLQFDIAAISQSILSGAIDPSATFVLRMNVAKAEKLAVGQVVEIYPVSESWTEGAGYFYQDIVEEDDGVTWKYRLSGSLWDSTGSTYLTTPSSSTTQLVDFEADVTEIVHGWISGSYDNNGLLLKFPTDDEERFGTKGWLKYFSINTHTVFLPRLCAEFDNSVYTGSVDVLEDSQNVKVWVSNLKKSYRMNSHVTARITARALYPVKTFTNYLTINNSTHRLPENSYYSIVDVQSQQAVVPFSEATKISSDASGSYFNFFVEGGMYPLRYYRILFKIDFDGDVQYLTDNDTFMVEL